MGFTFDEGEEQVIEAMAEHMTDDELAAIEQEIGDETSPNDEGDGQMSDGKNKTDLADIEKRENAVKEQETKMAEKALKLSEQKVRRFAEDKLVAETKLHPKGVDTFVSDTMELNLDDTTEVKDGKTRLDLYLDRQFETRGASADFEDTAEVPEQKTGPKKRGKYDAEVDGLGDPTDLELAQIEDDTGEEFSSEAEEFDALSLKIKNKLECSLSHAQDLAWQVMKDREEGE